MKKTASSKLSALLLTAFLLSHCAFAETPAERAAKAGELHTIKQHRVLRLFGNDVKERGFAHGYLLAEEIVEDLDSALKSLPFFGDKKYEARLLPWATEKFVWDADATAELDGIFEGMEAKLGSAGAVSKVLGRPMTRKDLNAMNAIADYFGPACSGFSVWDKRSADGGVLHARTLDFPIGARAVAGQVIVASEALPDRGKDRPARMAFVAIGWPGLIAQYTGMNADGLVVCIHDGYNTKAGDPGEGYAARGVLLRRVLETVNPADGDPAKTAAKLAEERPVACGNLFHLSWPAAAAKKHEQTPSAVLEFDSSEKKVEIVRMDKSGTLVLTNHFRVHNRAVACERFGSITKGAELLENNGKAVGITEARKLLMSAEQPIAAHSIYFQPDKAMLHVAMTRENVMSPRVAPTAFSFKELFEPAKK
ncbi:MAG TPA: C45 family autoproteolytic acyltransferase/hydrolase [Planctomycetota bacterium]|nr:C45 family autoproteolytic acyltransferase/hydrolase [Planctomycetota bacterium]